MIWFDKEHSQTICLKTYTGLVGKAPTKAKRLRMAFTLDLTSGDVQGMPDWMQDARDFVMRTGQTVTEKLSIPGINIVMGDPNLFKKKPVEAPKADLRKFVVYAAGDSEEPDTLLSFVAYAQFSTDLNRWLGQMNGEEFTCTFDGVMPQAGDTLALKPQDDSDDDEDDDGVGVEVDDDEGDEDDEDEEEDEVEAQARRRNAAASRPQLTPQPNAEAVAKARKNLSVM